MVDPAREDIVLHWPATPFEPDEKAGRTSLVISNWTGRLVFCWTTIARVLISGPTTTSRILILTRSQPRSLLSIARALQRKDPPQDLCHAHLP